MTVRTKQVKQNKNLPMLNRALVRDGYEPRKTEEEEEEETLAENMKRRNQKEARRWRDVTKKKKMKSHTE